MLASSDGFSITQFGLSAFCWEGGAYAARTFNFYTFPRPFENYDVRFVSQAASLAFLAGCDFDFNAWIKDGVPYMPLALRDAKVRGRPAPALRPQTPAAARGSPAPTRPCAACPHFFFF
jgi:poly(A)-specific ribonuclease